VVAALVVAACGGDKKKGDGSGSGTGTGSAEPPPPALQVPPLGVEAVKQFNYPYGDGSREYAKLLKAYKVEPRDWAAVRAAAEATLAKDPHHLDAHWVLGEALAHTGDGAGANQHLLAALAGDWLRWGPGLDQDPQLAQHLATPDGRALLEASAAMGDDLRRRVAASPLVLARRSTFKMPKPGTNYAATRGELYAYDQEAKRYLRLTHTDHQLAGYLRSAGGDEILLAGFDRATLPDPKKHKDDAPLLARSWVETFSLARLEDTSARATVAKARLVSAWYGTGDQVVVATAPADGRWGTGKPTHHVLDRSTGKLTKTTVAAGTGPVIDMTFDQVVVHGPGLTTPPAGLDPALMAKLLTDGGGPITLGEGGAPRLSSFVVSPAKTRIAFATATDPCNAADDAAKPSLYVVDTAGAAIKHVLTAPSRFAATWLGDDLLIYEDGSGGLRLYDPVAGRETGKLSERAGLALSSLSPTPHPLCRQEPIAAEPDDGTDSMPPEEAPASSPAP